MSRIILLSGILTVLVAAGATTLAFMPIKPEAVQQRAAPAEPINPAILSTHLKNIRTEMTLP
jgi:flagellar basal body-associated protein FliL